MSLFNRWACECGRRFILASRYDAHRLSLPGAVVLVPGSFRPMKPGEVEDCTWADFQGEYGGPKEPDLCSSSNAVRVFEFLQSDGNYPELEQTWVEEWPMCEAHAVAVEAEIAKRNAVEI